MTCNFVILGFRQYSRHWGDRETQKLGWNIGKHQQQPAAEECWRSPATGSRQHSAAPHYTSFSRDDHRISPLNIKLYFYVFQKQTITSSMLSSHLSSPQSEISYWRGFFAPGCSAGSWPPAPQQLSLRKESLMGRWYSSPSPPSRPISWSLHPAVFRQCASHGVAAGVTDQTQHRRPALLCRNAPARGKENLRLISINSMSKATQHIRPQILNSHMIIIKQTRQVIQIINTENM